jgi:hypothetical protein
MSKKEFIQCPICKPVADDEDCVFATIRRVEDGKTVIYCCAQQEKVKSRDQS